VTTIFDRLRKVIAEQLDVKEEEITPKTSFAEDLNTDSLDLIELITAVEEEFSQPGRRIEMSDEDAEKIKTAQDALEFLYDHGLEDN